MREYVLQIEDMSCSNCVGAVAKALAGVPGVRVMGVAIGSARIEADPGAVAGAIAALDGVGFPARADAAFAPKPNEPRTPQS